MVANVSPLLVLEVDIGIFNLTTKLPIHYIDYTTICAEEIFQKKDEIFLVIYFGQWPVLQIISSCMARRPQYLSRFIPNLASTSAHLLCLTKESNHFMQCGLEHQSAADKIKTVITSPESQRYFHNAKPVTIQGDASLRGLGGSLIQDKGPVLAVP
jgi:hypothetical protein